MEAVSTASSTTAPPVRTPRSPRNTKMPVRKTGKATVARISEAATAGAKEAAAAIVTRASPTRVGMSGQRSPSQSSASASYETRAAVEKAVAAVAAAVNTTNPLGRPAPDVTAATGPMSRAAVKEAMRAVEAAVTATKAAAAASRQTTHLTRTTGASRTPRTAWGTRVAAKQPSANTASAKSPRAAPIKTDLFDLTGTPGQSARASTPAVAESGMISPAGSRRASPQSTGTIPAKTRQRTVPTKLASSEVPGSETAATEAAVARALAAAAAAAAPPRKRAPPKGPRVATPPMPAVTIVTPTRIPRGATPARTVTPPRPAVTVVTPTRAPGTAATPSSAAPLPTPTRVPKKAATAPGSGAKEDMPIEGPRAATPKREVTIVTPTRVPREGVTPKLAATPKQDVKIVTPTRVPRGGTTPRATATPKREVTIVTPTRVPRDVLPSGRAIAEKRAVVEEPASDAKMPPVVLSPPTPKRRRVSPAKKGVRNESTEPAGANDVTTSSAGALDSLRAGTSSEADIRNNAASPLTVANPFRGLHEHITRSYRLDQILAAMKTHDLLLGRQEAKSAAFSFIRFACGPKFVSAHLESAGLNLVGGNTSNTKGRRSSGRNSDINPNENCPLIIAERLLAFPPHMHHFHTICGRDNVPCDFFADIDLPNETQSAGEKTLLEVLDYLDVRLEAIGFTRPSFVVLANETPNPEKVSYHLHARSMGAQAGAGSAATTNSDLIDDVSETGESVDNNSSVDDQGKPGQARAGKDRKSKASNGKIIAFQDYRVVKLLADEVNAALGRTVIDEQCYRSNGMLRCAYSSKITAPHSLPLSSSPSGYQRGKRLVPLLKASDSALQRRLDDISAQLHSFSEAQILERTFCIRTVPVKERPTVELGDTEALYKLAKARNDYLRAFKLIRAKHIVGPQGAQPIEYDAYGNVVSRYLTESAKWRRFKTAVEKLHRLPARAAECYDIWVRVGLALHNFSNEDHVFEEWVRFSLKCPQKYSRETCRRKWQQFDRNPDALNWRRGFNYLNSTVWRSVPGA
uniref:Uncharacterized protein n=1 Tax=Trypanosoma congolense (strain IL3000) TaxID=1068625 RepID=G0UJ45_TRYCI|nr:conserved hypothetical protein [Trypanosoma congolense IL3000]